MRLSGRKKDELECAVIESERRQLQRAIVTYHTNRENCL